MGFIRINWVSAAVVATSIAASGCADENQAAPASGPGGRGGGGAVPVTTAPVINKAMPIEISVIGTAEAFSNVAIRSQITGQLEKVNFTEGDEVQQGQVLFTLDRRPLELALREAQANLDRDSAKAENAALMNKRYEDLAKRGIAPREQVDTSRADMSALNATVSADKAAVESATVQLDYATIKAPISGRTGALMVHEGNLVRANDQTPLVTINQVMPMSVSFAIPEARLSELKRYMSGGSLRVTATPPNDEGPPAVGKIAFVDNAVDENTGTIRIKGTFPNSDRRLWPGQFVNVVVTLTTDPKAIVVPSVAVQSGQQGTYVFVVKADQTVEMRPVTVNRASASETVLADGVQPGDTVVTDGHLRLVPGSRISVKNEGQQADQSKPQVDRRGAP
ncbi:MAG TPA: efflux RND transporter periplasmic adaptor subunit [Vicinamibacterales bacterium]|jgi:membrane fusion protein, multidrug efflux system|nr:efflux RND transporter periplasmic adaptor subunit [Vicinamibacterales bacterium]